MRSLLPALSLLSMTSSLTEAFAPHPAFKHKVTLTASPTKLSESALVEATPEAAVKATPDRALAEKLLCANVVAQSIDSETQAYRKDSYYATASLTTEPIICIGGVQNNDCCMVSTIDDAIVVSFRGAADTVSDWANTFQLWKKSQAAGKFPGKLHSGFLGATSHIWSKDSFANAPFILVSAFDDVQTPKIYIRDAIQQLMNETGYKKIYITGHSKGSPMATLAAWFCHVDLGITPECYVFASPYVGNKEFADAYNEIVTQFTYENYYDIVCLIPPPEPEYFSQLSTRLASRIVPGDLGLIRMIFRAIVGFPNFLLDRFTGAFDYVHCGTRFIFKDEEVTVWEPEDNFGEEFEKYRDDRFQEIMAGLKDKTDSEVSLELGSQHAKEYTSDTSKGVYMRAVGGK